MLTPALLGDLEELVTNEAPCLDVLILRVAVLARQLVVLVLGKVVFNFGAPFNLLLENVLLVEEENEARVDQVLAEPDVLKELEALLQSVLVAVLAQFTVKARGVDDEENGGDAVKDLNPLASLTALTANIKHPENDYWVRNVNG